MSINQFLHKDNISTLWDVISDEDMFKFQKRDSQEKIYQMFVNNIKGFYDVERSKTNNVVDINKNNVKNYNAKDFLPKEINNQWFDTDFSQAKFNINDDKLTVVRAQQSSSSSSHLSGKTIKSYQTDDDIGYEVDVDSGFLG